MKFVGEYKEHLFTADGAIMVVFAARNGEKAKALQVVGEILSSSKKTAKEAVKYEITIKKYRPKRSINANDYCWKLLSELAKKLRVTKEDLYKQYIRDFGHYDEVWVKNEAAESVIRNWQSNGLGWLAETVSTGDKTVLWLYPGSSTFDSKTMHDFILAIVNDCKLEGIETRTPEEIAQMEGIREPKR